MAGGVVDVKVRMSVKDLSKLLIVMAEVDEVAGEECGFRILRACFLHCCDKLFEADNSRLGHVDLPLGCVHEAVVVLVYFFIHPYGVSHMT